MFQNARALFWVFQIFSPRLKIAYLRQSMNKIFVILFSVLLLTSCDPGLVEVCQIKNNANNSIKIKYRKVENYFDTLVVNVAQGGVLVLDSLHRLGTPETAQNDTFPMMSIIFISKDTVISTKDFTNRNEWNFIKTSKSSVTHELIIDDTNFQ